MLCVILGAGYYYFQTKILDGQSDLDAKSLEEQKEELVTGKEFQNLPEVIELKKQEAELQQAAPEKESLDKKNTPSKEEIENNLKQKLSALQGEYNGKLGGLIASAKGEYRQIASGQKSGSKSQLAEKYLGLAKSLEAQCDARVYAAIAIAENDLQKYGYRSDIMGNARQEYQQQKKERRRQLLSKL